RGCPGAPGRGAPRETTAPPLAGTVVDRREDPKDVSLLFEPVRGRRVAPTRAEEVPHFTQVHGFPTRRVRLEPRGLLRLGLPRRARHVVAPERSRTGVPFDRATLGAHPEE